jgi:RimJ/RimL family protein N-acetyltransferase
MAVIRQAEPIDAEGLVHHVRTVLGTSPYSLTTLDEFKSNVDSQTKWIEDMKRKDNLLLLAIDEGKIIGDLMLLRGPKLRNAHTAEFALGLQKIYRGQGIGKRLIQTMIEWTKTRPEIEKICLQVISGNDIAIRLYSNMGFKEEGRLTRQVKLNQTEYAR